MQSRASAEGATPGEQSATLADDAAWAIATAWRESLQGRDMWHKRLRLKTDTVDCDELALVQSYEWVKIKVTSDTEVANVCAAVTAWFWLSCCPGYSGTENPVFWKRVFSDLQIHRRGPPIMDRPSPRTDPSITDAVGFFDKPGRAFPRIRLKVPFVSTTDALFGTRARPVDPARDEKLADIYAYLQPFMVPSRLQRPVPVAVESKNWDDNAERIRNDNPPEPQSPMPELPRFVVHSRLLHAWSLRPQQSENAWLSDARLDVKTVTCGELWKDPESCATAEATKAIRSLFGLDSQHESARITALQLNRTSLSEPLLESVCSALPHAKRVTTVRMPTPVPRYIMPFGGRQVDPFRAFSAMDWAWIGYAIFHPDAQTSTWRDLDIGLDGLTPEAVNVLRLMATGNNFSCVENRSTAPTSRFYHTARLRCSTVVRLSASLSSEALIDMDEGSSVCLVVDGDDVDARRLEEWVRVVIPGLGFGWILSATIATVDSCAPGKSRLQGLRLYVADEDKPAQAVNELIEVIGENLARLHAESWEYLDSDKLTRLIRACPALQTLSVSVCSSTSLAEFETLPLLKELRLITSGNDSQILLPAGPPTGTLKALHVHTRRSYTPEHHEFIRTLLETYPKLEHLKWGEPPYDGFVDKYIERRDHTRKVIGDSPRVIFFCQPLHHRSRVAVRSVVCAKRTADTTNALGRMDAYVFKQIIDYAATAGRRDVWIS